MEIISYIILGLVQGIGEFLPISSSGHLIIASEFVNVPEDLALDVTLHLATLFVVIIYYKKDLISIFKSFVKDLLVSIKTSTNKFTKQSCFVFYVVLGCIPTFAIGFVFKDFFETQRSLNIVLTMLILVSFFMLLDVFNIGFKNKHFNYLSAIIIGFAQSVAMIPGTSRSGVTITTASLLGIKKEDGARFSFLLSIPVILVAFLLNLKDIESVTYFLNPNLLVAFVTAFISGFLSISILIKTLTKFGFLPFVVYRLVLVASIIFFLILK